MKKDITANILFGILFILIILMGFFYYYSIKPESEEAVVIAPEEVVVAEEPAATVVEEVAEEVVSEGATEEKPNEIVIGIKWKSFEPTGDVTVERGTTVRWVNKDRESPTKTHLISANRWVFRSEKLYEGDSFSYTFNDFGVYDYIDTIYGIRGRITVVEKEESLAITGAVVGLDGNEGVSGIMMVVGIIVLLGILFEIHHKKHIKNGSVG